ncbi:MAG TPA: hypothetical protein VFQ58_00035 [Flavisolibacter sp.]|jgi:hypothetical protein|nr:hypothetical protein [Flavisolibacter sp.]
MEVLQTHIVHTQSVYESLGLKATGKDSDYAVLFECEKNHWFVRIADQLKLITPESAIHIRCSK